MADGLADGGTGGTHVDGHPPLDGGRFGFRIQTGGSSDVLGGDPGDLSDPVQGVLGYPLFQVLEARAPGIHKLLVVETLGDDDVQHPQGQGGIGAGPKLQEVLGPGAKPGPAGIDDDEPGAPLHAVGDPVAVETIVTAGGRVLTPDHDDLR